MAKKNNINAHRRPMTKIEKEAYDTMMEELRCKVHGNDHNHWLLSDHSLSEVIRRAIAGVSLQRISHKESYQGWIDECKEDGEWWWLTVGPLVYKRVYLRAEELLKDRLEEIDNAQWYMVNFKDGDDGENRVNYFNADSIEEARNDVRSIWLWGNKLTSMFKATWDNVNREFLKGQRVSLAGVM